MKIEDRRCFKGNVQEYKWGLTFRLFGLLYCVALLQYLERVGMYGGKNCLVKKQFDTFFVYVVSICVLTKELEHRGSKQQ